MLRAFEYDMNFKTVLPLLVQMPPKREVALITKLHLNGVVAAVTFPTFGKSQAQVSLWGLRIHV